MVTCIKWLFTAAVVLAGVHASITDCSQGTSLFQLKELALTPDPPVAGEKLFMTVVFTNPGSEIDDGSVTTDVTLNFIPFTPSTVALCDSTECPLVSGFNNRSSSSVWPSNIAGKVVSKIVWSTLEEVELLCIKTTFSVGPSVSLRGKHNHSHPVHPESFAERLWKWQGSSPPKKVKAQAQAKTKVPVKPEQSIYATNLTVYTPFHWIIDDSIFPEDAGISQ